MTHLEYIIKQISKTNKKSLENYVITRVWHSLNRLDLKFITQQYVKRTEGYALTDLYLPQLDLHIEVKEPFHESQQELDYNRETDIIQATNHRIEDIVIENNYSLNEINEKIDSKIKIIRELLSEREKKGLFIPWNLEQEFNPQYHIDKGYLDATENPAFRKIYQACNCLGQNYKERSRISWAKSKKYENHYIWFPKFYNNNEWDNWISDDDLTVTEICKTESKKQKHFDDIMNNPVRRIVFPRSKDNLNFNLYRFKGIYETDTENSSIENGVIHRRINTLIDL